MKKNYILAATLIVAAIVAITIVNRYSSSAADDRILARDYENATYVINGQAITLTDGISEEESTPGSAAKTTTRYFGNEVIHDLDGDGRQDIAFLLTQSSGGTGTFYYVVAAVNTEGGYKGGEAFLLGDRIAPQSTNIDDGPTANGTNRQNVIVVNYAIRRPSDPFTVAPSVGKSIWLKLDPTTMKFGEVAQNFEGEQK